MNAHLFRCIIAAALILIAAAQADACNRCGRFGSACSFAHVHHAPMHHEPTPSVTNFVFNATHPYAIPFPQAGASVFGHNLGGYGLNGFSLNAQAQYVDPAMLADRAARFTELAHGNAGDATKQFSTLAAQMLAINDQNDQRQKNAAIATVAISAIGANAQPSPQAQSLKVSVSSTGQTVAEWLPADDKPAEFKLQGGPEISLTCAKCHDKPADSAPGGFQFNGKFNSQDQLDWAKEAVWSGKMPPNVRLDRHGKSKVAEKMQSLLK